MTALLCDRCGKRVDPVAAPRHPSCEPEIRAAFAASDRRAREALRRALAAKGRALAVVEDAHPDAMAVALDIIEAFAAEHRTFSANDTRPALDEAGVPNGGVRGAAFNRAIKRGLIRKIGYTASTSATTNAHEIKQYESLNARWREAS